MGFSLGGIMTDLLATVRGDVLASVATYSGGYFSNPANDEVLGIAASMVSWPEPTSANMYGQLLCHGDADDNFNLTVVTIQFDELGNNDVAFLNAEGHDVVHCVNDSSSHGDLAGLPSPSGFVEFFAAHPLGTADSPWSDGLPDSGFGLCTFAPKAE